MSTHISPAVILQELASVRKLKDPVFSGLAFWRSYIVMATIAAGAAFYPKLASARDAGVLAAVLIIALGSSIIRDCARAVNRNHERLVAHLESKGLL